MSKLVRALVFPGALVLVLAAMALLGARSGDRIALQQYLTELRAKGEKLTFADLTRGRQTNTNGSHSIITNAVAKFSGAPLYPGLLEVRKYVGPGQARVTWRQASPTWTQLAGSASPGAWEEFATQMQAAQGALQEIREALKEPAADAGPCTDMLAGRRVNFVAIRTAAHWLMGAAENDLHQGRLEAGLQDLEALAGLARMEKDEPTLVAQMIRVAVASIGLALTWEALQAPGWTELQLVRLQKAWETVDLVEALEKGFWGERAGGHECFATVRHSSGPKLGRFIRGSWSWGAPPSKTTFEDLMMNYLYCPAYKLTSIDADELFYLKTMQEMMAAPRLLKAHRPWPEASQAGLKVNASINKICGSPGKVRYLVSLMTVPNFTRAGERAVEAEVERQMTLAAIALKRYQLRHGKLPSSLEALVPEFLPALPYDYMSAKPLCYRLKTDGSYVLYSVGVDGKDDGGDSTAASLWGGRDAVWPSAASGPEEPPKGTGTGAAP